VSGAGHQAVPASERARESAGVKPLGKMFMWRLERIGWNFSSTAEIATGVLLLATIVSVLFVKI